MEEKSFQDIMISFRSIYRKREILLNYINYYNALISWIKEHINLFSKEQIETYRLDVLMNINPNYYIVDNPELCLEQEYKRIGKRKYDTVDSLLMSISDTLWDLVTIKSGKNCPNCVFDELRYVVAVDKKRNILELLLECETCGWTEYINGKQWAEGIVKIIPACIDDVKNSTNK